VRSASSICMGCGADNVANRMLCRVCGLDLGTGDRQLTVEPSPPDAWSEPGEIAPVDDGRDAAVRWWVPALAAILVLVGVATAIVALELGPFAPTTDVPPADFDAAAYPGEPRTLTLTGVATLTSQSPVGARSFTPEHLVDGDPTTAWHGDASALPPETEEKIDLFLDRPAWVSALVIDNGDQMDADAYATTSRVQRAMLVFDGDVRVPVTLLDQGLEPQIVELEEPLLTVTVRLDILETISGTDLDEVAISRLELLGFPADGDDVALAEERVELLPGAGAISIPE